MEYDHLLSVAPMLGWSDRHCRYFHRLVSPHAFLYTEMISTGALLYGGTSRYLSFSSMEKPLALQLGGSNLLELSKCASLGQEYGFDEINLNCGCPSPRVTKGAFGACLMANPSLVADCWVTMHKKTNLPVTIKHRIGIDDCDSYSFLFNFVSSLYQVGCRNFIIHARKAILKGLTPKENRQIPALVYDYVYQIKSDFPDCRIIINGGIKNLDDVLNHLKLVDGIMIGREAYQNPFFLLQLEKYLFSKTNKLDSEELLLKKEHEIFSKYLNYVDNELTLGQKLPILLKPVLGWRRGHPGSRSFRQILSDSTALCDNDVTCFVRALNKLSIYL